MNRQTEKLSPLTIAKLFCFEPSLRRFAGTHRAKATPGGSKRSVCFARLAPARVALSRGALTQRGPRLGTARDTFLQPCCHKNVRRALPSARDSFQRGPLTSGDCPRRKLSQAPTRSYSATQAPILRGPQPGGQSPNLRWLIDFRGCRARKRHYLGGHPRINLEDVTDRFPLDSERVISHLPRQRGAHSAAP